MRLGGITMKVTKNERMPKADELAQELSNFLNQKFGSRIKIIPTAAFFPDEDETVRPPPEEKDFEIKFDLKPEELVAYLDQYIVRQDKAKAILATKICTHFNRVKYQRDNEGKVSDTVGRIKNNVLMLGPTGVGKTYLIKLIANKLGVPFVKGDATKFTEAGYVGADVEDLIRDLLREADHNLELAQYGIVYIDEVDKIASSNDAFGHDISRSGVQRALLKPMEETDIDLKASHDPIGIMEDFESYRKTGKRNKRVLNTRNILFIMSGAFADIKDIIKKRVASQKMGFGAKINTPEEDALFLRKIKSEDLIEYGFESEFVGRLPVNAVLDPLSVDDLFTILKNPNNPTILGKKMDFMAYEIKIKFSDEALFMLAEQAYSQKTGARGLVSAIEEALLIFEKKLPSTKIKKIAITKDVISSPQKVLDSLLADPHHSKWTDQYNRVANDELANMSQYIQENRERLSKQFSVDLTDNNRVTYLADYCCQNIMDLETSFSRIQTAFSNVDKIETDFKKAHKIEIILETSARDYLVQQQLERALGIENFFEWFNKNFEYALKLIHEKKGQSSFVIPKEALVDSEVYLENLVKDHLQGVGS
ncbi:MAG: ATPase AAA-2 domain-containing protein [Candidatus Magnetoglobus multicellularis str. Araruama]|uniref:ATPase AAA-2 domain-containing protein n=1 Tax=Candidatus Magnetoglobus multicellularis str. Araruama TaxID=890399 RepID=A0A1V1P6J9_9BACT|nr:MAG: ATPase AAA-2 domain-containing protein [Candidatus Magnetoglobus multicellularis str. Araruama]